MTNKWLIVLLIFSMAINVAAVVTIGIQWSRHFPRHHPLAEPPFSDRHREMLHRRLDLSEGQIKAVRDAQDRFAEEMKTMQTSLRTKREALFHQVQAPEPDRAKIDTLLVEIATIQADVERKVVDNLLEMKDALTPEQREKLLSLIDRRFRDHRPRFGPWNRERGEFPPPDIPE